MVVLFISLFLNCSHTRIENTSDYPLNEYDYEMFRYAEKRCSKLYPNSPCVKLFRKWGFQDYSVICGEKD